MLVIQTCAQKLSRLYVSMDKHSITHVKQRQLDTVLFVEGACNSRTCTQTYAPVCGENSMTYLNACIAERSGTRIQYAGCVLSKEQLVKRFTCLSAALTREHTTISVFWIMLVLSLPMRGVCFGQSR